MKIAIIHPGMDVKGGAENIVVWLAQGLMKRGHDVTVLAERYVPDYWPSPLTKELKVRLFPRFRLSRILDSNAVRMWERTRQLKKMLDGTQIVIAQLFPSYCWAVKARELTRAPWRIVWLCQEPVRKLHSEVTDRHLLNWREHTPSGITNEHIRKEEEKRRNHLKKKGKVARNRKWDLQSARSCDVVITNSAFTGSNVQKIFSIHPTVCHLGIPFEEEKPFHEGDYLAVLTTFRPAKNVHNIIRAAKELEGRQGCRDVKWKIAGQGDDRRSLERMVQDLGLVDKVEFVGLIPDEDLPEFFRKARAAVYCPIDEPFGLVPLEALAQKTPVVVSNHGGPLETVDHEITGIHVNPFDPAHIASGAEALWRDPAKARAMGEAGCRKTRDYFSLDSFLERFELIALHS